MHHVSMTDGCQMAARERAEKGTILACFCLTRPLDPQEKADTWCTRGGVPGEARLNREPQENLTPSSLSQLCPRSRFPAYPKAEKQGEEGSQAVPILAGAASLHSTNANKILYRNHSENRCWGRCIPQGLHLSSVVKRCSGDGTRVLPACEGPSMHEGHGPAL